MDHVHVIITHNHSDSDRQLSVLQPGAPTGKVRLLAPGQSVGMVCDSPITIQPGGLVNPPEPEATDIDALECETLAVGMLTTVFQRVRKLAMEQAGEALDLLERKASIHEPSGSVVAKHDAAQRQDFIERAAVVACRRLEDALIAMALPGDGYGVSHAQQRGADAENESRNRMMLDAARAFASSPASRMAAIRQAENAAAIDLLVFLTNRGWVSGPVQRVLELYREDRAARGLEPL